MSNAPVPLPLSETPPRRPPLLYDLSPGYDGGYEEYSPGGVSSETYALGGHTPFCELEDVSRRASTDAARAVQLSVLAFSWSLGVSLSQLGVLVYGGT